MPRFDICLTDGVSLEVSFHGEYADLRDAASVARERAQERMEGHPEVGFPLWSGGFCKEPKHPRRMEWHTNDLGDGLRASTRPKRFSV